ncbi:hypothetical protein [Stenotrophomonas sp. MMGLT7]|uniref:hypothetical protein n=1 Tax=Stenotrophomonas sp. MMGLT7 TaxID=2901227 RepID=UPI001E4B94D6|nr:hypothetical protein [Stenotrophomonas sp. MMGLT7]MCD7098992.1 hypothetical protein [Stenotrophomonas sp. MMGLT7]
MSEIIESAPENQGTSVSRFLANRGAIVVKETRPVGRLKGEHGDVVSAETMILNVVKGTKKDTSYGVRLERSDSGGDFDSAVFIDYDELDELIGAIDFISTTATQLQNQARDYTEVTYSTKDSAKVGFYHSKEGQLAFLMLSDHRGNTFLPVHRLAILKQIFQDAKSHLTASGATDD